MSVPGFVAERSLSRTFGAFRTRAFGARTQAGVVPASLFSRCNGYCDPRWGGDPILQYPTCMWICFIAGGPPIVRGPGGPGGGYPGL
jgi:hypothetical protein